MAHAGLARQGTIPIWVGIWSPNIITAALGLYLLPRLERMPGSSRTNAALEWIDEEELVEVTPKSVRLRNRVLRTALRNKHRIGFTDAPPAEMAEGD